MVDMNTITKPPWPDPLSQAPSQATWPSLVVLPVFSVGYGFITNRGCIMSRVGHGFLKSCMGCGSLKSSVGCRLWVVALSSPAWVMMGWFMVYGFWFWVGSNGFWGGICYGFCFIDGFWDRFCLLDSNFVGFSCVNFAFKILWVSMHL